MTVNMIKLVKVNVYQLTQLVLTMDIIIETIAYFVIMLFPLQLQSNQKHWMECTSEHSTLPKVLRLFVIKGRTNGLKLS